MKKQLNILAVLISISMLAACYLPDWLTYTNVTYGFEIMYPPPALW